MGQRSGTYHGPSGELSRRTPRLEDSPAQGPGESLPIPPHERPVGADAHSRRTRATRGLHPRTEATELIDRLDKVLAENRVGVGKAWHAAGHVAVAQHVGEQLHAVGAEWLAAEDRHPARDRDVVAGRQLAELAPSSHREERMGDGGLDLTPEPRLYPVYRFDPVVDIGAGSNPGELQ